MNREQLLRRRFLTIFGYTIGAVVAFAAGVLIFSLVEQDRDFAISVFGSLVGGFLGALLASTVVIDVYIKGVETEKD